MIPTRAMRHACQLHRHPAPWATPRPSSPARVPSRIPVVWGISPRAPCRVRACGLVTAWRHPLQSRGLCPATRRTSLGTGAQRVPRFPGVRMLRRCSGAVPGRRRPSIRHALLARMRHMHVLQVPHEQLEVRLRAARKMHSTGRVPGVPMRSLVSAKTGAPAPLRTELRAAPCIAHAAVAMAGTALVRPRCRRRQPLPPPEVKLPLPQPVLHHRAQRMVWEEVAEGQRRLSDRVDVVLRPRQPPHNRRALVRLPGHRDRRLPHYLVGDRAPEGGRHGGVVLERWGERERRGPERRWRCLRGRVTHSRPAGVIGGGP